jgi:hypothetical protein
VLSSFVTLVDKMTSSPAYAFFTDIKDPNNDSIILHRKCNARGCTKQYAVGSSTHTLMKHAKKHPRSGKPPSAAPPVADSAAASAADSSSGDVRQVQWAGVDGGGEG